MVSAFVDAHPDLVVVFAHDSCVIAPTEIGAPIRVAESAGISGEAAPDPLCCHTQPGHQLWPVALQARHHDTERCDDLPGWLANGHRHRAGADARLLLGLCEAIESDPNQLQAQPARLDDRVRRDPDQRRQHLGLHRARCMSEKHLADSGGMLKRPRFDAAFF